jgi:hypothetical protein
MHSTWQDLQTPSSLIAGRSAAANLIGDNRVNRQVVKEQHVLLGFAHIVLALTIRRGVNRRAQTESHSYPADTLQSLWRSDAACRGRRSGRIRCGHRGHALRYGSNFLRPHRTSVAIAMLQALPVHVHCWCKAGRKPEVLRQQKCVADGYVSGCKATCTQVLSLRKHRLQSSQACQKPL